MAKKRTRFTIAQKIVYAAFLCLGFFILLWGAWIHFSGLGTRPAGLEYLMMIVGAVFVIGVIIVILASAFMSPLNEEPQRKDTHSSSNKRESEP
jgi:hypothetical protein